MASKDVKPDESREAALKRLKDQGPPPKKKDVEPEEEYTKGKDPAPVHGSF